MRRRDEKTPKHRIGSGTTAYAASRLQFDYIGAREGYRYQFL